MLTLSLYIMISLSLSLSLPLSLSLSLSDAASETSEVASTELPTLTESQTKELEKAYINGQYQDAAVLRELARRLELTDNQIQVRVAFAFSIILCMSTFKLCMCK